MSDHVGEIKARLNVADVIGGYIKLERAGANMKARCPFHNEKTASFFVSPGRGSYYCFGCGAKGDIFTFVEEFEGLDFMGTLKVLAERAGVELTFERKQPGARNERERLFGVMEAAAAFYQRTLYEGAAGPHKAVIDYLLGRGLTKETIKAWRIGYAPIGWRNALDYLLGRGFTEAEILSAGIAKRKDGKDGEEGESAVAGRGVYDRIRSRITFPLLDSSGRVVAFSGRIFPHDDAVAKYLNSPETPLWHKSHFLYGLHRAKYGIREKGFAILVEGQMDIIMSHQAGWHNALATSGTALTAEHLATIRRFTDYVRMAFDPDNAGQKAALRSARMAVAMGLDVRIIELPKGKDPADLIRDDAAEWTKRVEAAQSVVDYFLHRISEAHPDARTLGVRLREEVLPFVASAPNAIEQNALVSSIARRTGIKEDAILEEVRRVPPLENVTVSPAANTLAATGTSNASNASNTTMTNSSGAQQGSNQGHTASQTAISTPQGISGIIASAVQKSRKSHIEERLAGLIFMHQSRGKDERVNFLKEAVIADLSAPVFEAIVRDYEPRREELIVQAEILYGSEEDIKKKEKQYASEARELIVNLAEDVLKDTLATALTELAKAEKAKDTARVHVEMQTCKDVSSKLALLRKRLDDH